MSLLELTWPLPLVPNVGAVAAAKELLHPLSPHPLDTYPEPEGYYLWENKRGGRALVIAAG